jgi:hypothetical protein
MVLVVDSVLESFADFLFAEVEAVEVAFLFLLLLVAHVFGGAGLLDEPEFL